MTEEDFNHWLGSANPGAKFAYAEASCLALAGGKTQRVAMLALQAFYAGRVDLVQKRLSGPPDGHFRYLAIKRQVVREQHIPHWLSLSPKAKVAA